MSELLSFQSQIGYRIEGFIAEKKALGFNMPEGSGHKWCESTCRI